MALTHCCFLIDFIVLSKFVYIKILLVTLQDRNGVIESGWEVLINPILPTDIHLVKDALMPGKMGVGLGNGSERVRVRMGAGQNGFYAKPVPV
ncbi:hypothetical protein R6Q59_021756 [Mikania micrantha]